MIAKKNPRYNLEGKRIVIFSLGLLTTTAATLAAFTYQSPYEFEMEKERVKPVAMDYTVVEKDPIIKQQDLVIQPIVQPQTQADESQSATASTSVDISQDVTAADNQLDLPDLGVLGRPDFVVKKQGGGEIERDRIEPFPKIEAEFVGGYPKMQEFIVDNTNYPEQDLQGGISGVVYVSFVVEKNGSISNVLVEKGVSTNLDREAKRVVKKFPNWIPAENEGEKVRTIIRLPIRFLPQ